MNVSVFYRDHILSVQAPTIANAIKIIAIKAIVIQKVLTLEYSPGTKHWLKDFACFISFSSQEIAIRYLQSLIPISQMGKMRFR